MNKKAFTIIGLFFLALFAVSATIGLSNAEISLLVTPLSDEPGNVVAVRSELSGEFEALSTVGIGFGAEVEVINEAVMVTSTGTTSAEGYTANTPIKPGSFEWSAPYGALTIVVFDLGDGTLDDNVGFLSSGTINYTSGYFSRIVQMGLNFDVTNNKVNYTTYELDVTPAAGATVSGSGVLITTITVPQVDNGNYPITAIDEAGNIGTVNFQVIPEPLTVGAIVLLSTVAVMVSVYWLRKRPYTKNIT